MSFPDLLEGPDQTLFLLEVGQIRIIGAQGSEVVAPLADFLAFLVWVTSRYPSLFTAPRPPEGLKARLTGLFLQLQPH
jgi:hypothetical protein